jgi:hypothetical protein
MCECVTVFCCVNVCVSGGLGSGSEQESSWLTQKVIDIDRSCEVVHLEHLHNDCNNRVLRVV